MNRRMALLMTMLMGGTLPRALFAQSPGRRATAGGRSRVASGSDPDTPSTRTRKPADADLEEPAEAEPADAGTSIQTIPAEPGQRYRQFDISRYTRLDSTQPNPQNFVTEWIFRTTGAAVWHGEKLAALSASRSQIRAYNSPKVIEQTFEIIERFINPKEDYLSVHVRFVAAVDTRWRYTMYSNLTPVASGPQGQQIWTLKAKDAALVLAQMQLFQGFRLLTDQNVTMVNGQTLTIKTTEPRGFVGGMQREPSGVVGFQPKADQIEEGVTLKLSPLLTLDGDATDAAVEVSANTVKNLHRTRVIAPREVSPSEITIDVPEVVESRLSQTIKDWPVGETLLVAAGIHPGILQNKGGFMNLRIPGTVPTTTELLIFIDIEPTNRVKKTAARR